MLWFGNLRQYRLCHFSKFKNILCYGSAKELMFSPYCFDTFKNILCYGSAIYRDDCIHKIIKFKNILCYGSAIKIAFYERRKTNLKTSYVMVRRHRALATYNLFRFKNILCYGSAHSRFVLFALRLGFKNILCYGSA